MVEGLLGLIVAPRGHEFRVLQFTLANDRIAGMEVGRRSSTPDAIEAAALAVNLQHQAPMLYMFFLIPFYCEVMELRGN